MVGGYPAFSVFFFFFSFNAQIRYFLNHLQLLRPKQQLRIFFWAEWPMCLLGCTEAVRSGYTRRLNHIAGSHSSRALFDISD